MEKQEVVLGPSQVLYSLDKQGRLKRVRNRGDSPGDFIFLGSPKYSGNFSKAVDDLKSILRDMHFISPEDFLGGLRVVLEKWQEEKEGSMEKSFQKCFPDNWEAILGNSKALNKERGGAVALDRLLPKMVSWIDCFIVAS